jgi:hypothetical protein
MFTKLGRDRTMYNTHGFIEADFIEVLNHHARAKLS